MRLWTIHPRYLDAKGLVAAWREGLLAQKVLMGATRGYRNHPQLTRFRAQKDPLPVIAAFLAGLAAEAARRGYRFDVTKISKRRFRGRLRETKGQLHYEWGHLMTKLQVRAPELHVQYLTVEMPEPHPIFRIVAGEVREWERMGDSVK